MKAKFFTLLIVIGVLSCSKSKMNVVGSWVEPIPGMEPEMQGINIEPGGKASSINMATLQYESWELDNNKLFLTGKSIGNGQTLEFTDTMTVIKSTTDSLILQTPFKYMIRYSRKL